MAKYSKCLKYSFATSLCLFVLTSCTSKFLKYEGDELNQVEKEFAKEIKIIEVQVPQPKQEEVVSSDQTKKEEFALQSSGGESANKETSAGKNIQDQKDLKKEKKSQIEKSRGSESKSDTKISNEKYLKKNGKDKKEKKSKNQKRQPEIEDSEGFDGRRPFVDPFRVGEEVVHDVHYFKVSAGELKFKVEPFVKVNDRLSYKYAIEIRSNDVFSRFYTVEDRAETLVDHETLVPTVYQLHVKESGQLREGRMIFDSEKKFARYFEKKISKGDGVEEKKQEWEILNYSQNIFSAIFYIRNFTWYVGKEVTFRVADDNENLEFKAKAMRKETIDTGIGKKEAIVIKPEVIVKGFFKPVGDIYIWLSNDDRKYVLKTESKIKVGTIVTEVVSINPGE